MFGYCLVTCSSGRRRSRDRVSTSRERRGRPARVLFAGPPRCDSRRRRGGRCVFMTACPRASPAPSWARRLGAIVQVEGGDCAGGLSGLHRLDHPAPRWVSERAEKMRRVNPSGRPFGEDVFPVEVAGLQHGAGFVGAVVERPPADEQRLGRGRCRRWRCSVRPRHVTSRVWNHLVIRL